MVAGPAQAGCPSLEAWRLGVAPFGFVACGSGLGEGGGTFRHCMKPFLYRDPAAQAEFHRLNSEIASCVGQDLAMPEDAVVSTRR